jgi:hypothetical protein
MISNVSYTPDISPHTDGYRHIHLVKETIPGFRQPLNESLPLIYETLSQAQKKGFATCLFNIISNILPSAYIRNRDIWLLQEQIENAVRDCLDSKVRVNADNAER